MGHDFKLLKFGSLIFRIVAIGAFVIGLIGAVGVLVTGGTPNTPRSASIVIFLISLLYLVIFYTAGEIIRILLVIEEQTRKS